jgi:hypothetical protein
MQSQCGVPTTIYTRIHFPTPTTRCGQEGAFFLMFVI